MSTSESAPKKSWLPPLNSKGYYVLLGAIAILVLGPLGGVTASYMNFSLGFFVGGQVLAGILGSTVTYFYGPEGKHGANYMQTMAASVASMAAMGVLIQAMTWLGLAEPETWKLVLYFLCIGMFGVGVGMLYTPILVDKLQLTYPSGLAVANILRALTDLKLLKRSVGKLFTGMFVGFVVPLVGEKGPTAAVDLIGRFQVSTSTLGAGMIVGARIGVPAITFAFFWEWLTPWLKAQVTVVNGQEYRWLGEHDPYRKFAFIVALGTIMGAAIVDISIILFQAYRRLQETKGQTVEVPKGEEWKKTNTTRLVAWAGFWAVALTVVATTALGMPIGWVLLAIALVFVFMMVNGISQGISDSNPISSAFVTTVLIMAGIGLTNPVIGLLAGGILLVATAVGCDMQQDRSTGWRLGTDRTIQFRYQVVGIIMGAFLAVVMAKVFMAAYPVLKVDTFSHPELKVAQWQSAMTYKFVGVLRGLTSTNPVLVRSLLVGVGIGFTMELIRKLVKTNARYRAWVQANKNASIFDFVFDAILMPSPYASSFAGFVEFPTAMWFGWGGVVGSIWGWLEKRGKKGGDDDLPEDMSTVSLFGGGLIAGDSLAALALGLMGLGKTLFSAPPPPPPPPPAG
jgi:uncharacterized oligopeptide transporter (OPT) family protein